MAQVTLEKLEELSYGKKEAFNSLRTNLGFCGEDIRAIAFTSCTPDEGKSSTVMELARAYAENGKKVLLIDADAQGSLTASLGFQEPDKLDVTLATVMAINIIMELAGKRISC